MHPHILELNGFVIHTYHVALAVVSIFLFLSLYLLSERTGASKKEVVNFLIIVFVAGVIGWRVMLIAGKFMEVVENPDRLQRYIMWGNSFGGIALIGGLSSYFYIRRRVKNLWRFYDELVPLIFFSFAMLKILGCFLTGCCFGLPTELPWGVSFPPNSLPSLFYPPGTKIHPVQLYEAGAGIILGIFSIWMNSRKRKDGETSMTAVPLYALERFIVGFWRWRSYAIGSLSLTQVFAIAVIFFWIPLLVNFYKKPPAEVSEPLEGW